MYINTATKDNAHLPLSRFFGIEASLAFARASRSCTREQSITKYFVSIVSMWSLDTLTDHEVSNFIEKGQGPRFTTTVEQ